jgi:uncharacterized protein (DUF983 family)
MTQVNPILSGLACRCPNCGKGKLFDGFLAVSARCDACGYDLRAADSGDGPAVFVILIVGFVVCFAALAVEIAVRPPIWLHLIIWLPLTAILVLALVRPVKGVMLALQFHHKASAGGRDDL